MSKIHIIRSHRLGLEAARVEVERIAQRVQEEFGANYAWDGDTLRFSRSGVSGHISITADGLELIIKLGLLLSAMQGQIERRLVAKIDQRLARHARGDIASPHQPQQSSDPAPGRYGTAKQAVAGSKL
jgi:putative polyhydroxyalkanoate system protein